MVRSYAAFISSRDLESLGSLNAIFGKFPKNLEKPGAVLPPLEISESVLSRIAPVNLPGLVDIARQLGSPKTTLPLIWASNEPYLPTVDALWARLPGTLRPAFAFGFQFAPEHRMPVTPVLVATMPSLAGRWSTGYVIQTHARDIANLNSIQGWLAGLSEPREFAELLSDYGIVVKQFSELNLISLFADSIARLPELSFGEVRKAVRIVEKHSKTTHAAGKNRAALFARLCALVSSATPDDIATLRNLNRGALADLIEPLQEAIKARLRTTTSPEQYIKNLEIAVESSNIWWSRPFMEWVEELFALSSVSATETLIRLLASGKVSQFVAAGLGRDRATEERLLGGLPKKVDHGLCDAILELAEGRGWMRLHAACLLRNRGKIEAIKVHAAVAGMRTDGFELLYEQVGFIPLLQASCAASTQNLIEYAGSLLQKHASEVTRDFFSKCAQWIPIVTHNINQSTGKITGPLRPLVIGTLECQTEGSIDFSCLCSACTKRDVTVWFELRNPDTVLALLSPEIGGDATKNINAYIVEEIKAGRSIAVVSGNSFREVLDAEAVIQALASVPRGEVAKAGVSAFRSFPCLSDSDCCRWLIDLFTRTHFLGLRREDTSEIASVLLAADYPKAAAIVKDTSESYFRSDVVPVFQEIRYKYEMARQHNPKAVAKTKRLPKVLIATALPLERDEVIAHLGPMQYNAELLADVAQWPENDPLFEVYIIVTGAGNLDAQRRTLNLLKGRKPKFAFFIGVGGGVKDSNVGDVAYSTKVYYYEGGKEEGGGMKSRPNLERASDSLVQLAHRVARQPWQPLGEIENGDRSKAIPAVFASGEVVLASTEAQAATFQHIKASYGDTQIVEMEGYGFLSACRDENIRHCMVIRGVSDKLAGKAESDQKGNQPLAARNAAAFLFAVLRSCPDILKSKKKKKLFGML